MYLSIFVFSLVLQEVGTCCFFLPFRRAGRRVFVTLPGPLVRKEQSPRAIWEMMGACRGQPRVPSELDERQPGVCASFLAA